MTFKLETGQERVVRIKVVGVGGGGNNVVKRMASESAQDIEYIAINTDKQALETTKASLKVQIGEKLTHGQGAGSNPEIGRKSAEESHTQIANSLENTDMVFITAGMGGGTGTGAAPIVAEIARNKGILTIGVVTKPFGFEGRLRMKQAEKGISTLKEKVDALVIIPNDRLKNASTKKITLVNAFEIADSVLKDAVQSISDLISSTGFINLDFADVCTIMRNAGLAHMGVGCASGKDKAEEAARMAISSPLLETSIHAARGILINITGSMDIGLDEVERTASLVQQSVHQDANIIFGAVFDETMVDELRVTVIATGLEENAPLVPPKVTEPNSQKAEESQTKYLNKPINDENKSTKPGMALDEVHTARQDTSSPSITSTQTAKADDSQRADTPVSKPATSQLPSSRVSARTAFDNMLNEMQQEAHHSVNTMNKTPTQASNIIMKAPPVGKTISSDSQEPSSDSATQAMPFQSDTSFGVTGIERKNARLNKTASEKAPAVESSASDSYGKADGIGDPWEAIRRIFENRDKKPDN